MPLITAWLVGVATPVLAGAEVVINREKLSKAQIVWLEQQLNTHIVPGRYWLDANGNAGFEGQPAAYNLFDAMHDRNRSNTSTGSAADITKEAVALSAVAVPSASSVAMATV